MQTLKSVEVGLAADQWWRWFQLTGLQDWPFLFDNAAA